MYGHRARIWKVCGFGQDKLVTCSEDTTVRVWDVTTSTEVEQMQGMLPLAGKNVRGLAVFGDMIASGAEDSSVRIFTQQLNTPKQSVRVAPPGLDL